MVSTASPESTVSWAGVAAPKRLSDYRPFPFAIPRIGLNVVVHQPDSVLVTADLDLEPCDQKVSTPLILSGVDLELVSIALNGQPLETSSYRLKDELLEILSQTRDPHAVQPHMSKCFDAVKRIVFGEGRRAKGPWTRR